MTQAENTVLSSRSTGVIIDTDSTESFNRSIETCSIVLLSKLICENIVCYAQYRFIVDWYVAFEYISVRPELTTNFRIRITRLIAFESKLPNERLFNEAFMGDFISIYTDLVSQRTKYLDPYYGEAKPLGSQGVQGVLGSEHPDSEESLSVTSILHEAGLVFQSGDTATVWDNLTHLSIELLAWIISQNVECTLEDRCLLDWLTAEKRVRGNQLLIIAILQATYSPIPFGTSREIFNSRCAEILMCEFNVIVRDRATCLGPEYGDVKTATTP